MKLPLIGNSPIRKNMIANLFGVGVQLMNQILLVPFYILFWGNKQYTDWIVISSLTTIFSMSDVGLNNVIQNRFAIKFTEGNIKECQSLLTNNFILVVFTLLFTLLGCLLFVTYWDITKVMNLHILTRDVANSVFIILLIKIFIGMFSGIENAIYRANHQASTAVYMDQLGILTVAIITLICIVIKVPIILMCFLICIPQLTIIIIKYFHSKKLFVYHFTFKSFDLPLMKSIILPSLSFMSFPIGNTIVLQGYTLVVNSYFGADSVVLYNTTRTLCNFIKTFLSTLQSAVWPEYSIAYGNNDFLLMRHLHRKILKITLIISILMGVALVLFGPFIYKIWTHNSVEFSYSLMITYILVLITESLWTSSAVTLMATNNHSKLGFIYISVSIITLLFAVIVAKYFNLIWYVAATLIVMHVIISCYTVKAGFKFTQDKFSFK